ncbi:MAG: MBL fold metallo-hydrolase [Rubricoccaceae bacterium]|nr:MBL fold metallo-hydrolase [Rubricoccaceae bacterium]
MQATDSQRNTDENSLHVRFWGVRGSIGTPSISHLGVGGNTPCVEVWSTDGSHCIFDLGSGARDLGNHLRTEKRKNLTIFLTHFHWDHIQGMPFFSPFFDPNYRLDIFAPDVDGDPRELLERQMAAPNFPISFDHLLAEISVRASVSWEEIAVGSLTIEPFPVQHTHFVHGFSITLADSRVVFCTDYEHGNPERDAQLFDIAAGADLLICDAQYTPDEYTKRVGWGHSTWKHAAQLARQAEVGKLALFHHDPEHDDAQLAEILERAKEIFPATILATEGQELQF